MYDLPEWQFFLDNIRDEVLVEGGRLCLKFNFSHSRSGREPDDPELVGLFGSRGGRYYHTGRYVIFDPLH